MYEPSAASPTIKQIDVFNPIEATNTIPLFPSLIAIDVNEDKDSKASFGPAFPGTIAPVDLSYTSYPTPLLCVTNTYPFLISYLTKGVNWNI